MIQTGSTSVVICTYNAERELELALASMVRQSLRPDEVLIADDGSGPATAEIVGRYARNAPFPIRHLRHEDEGCRRARIVNESVRAASNEYLLFIDGDCFPHRDWVRDHLLSAKPGRVLCGRRVKLGPRYSAGLNANELRAGKWDGWPPRDLRQSQRAGDSLRVALGIRLPRLLARSLHPFSRRLMGCNFSLPRPAFEEVNGFDEAWPGSALLSDDFDLELRLRRAGWKLVPILNRGIVYHVHHSERPKTAEEEQLRRDRAANTPARAVRGLAEHPGSNPGSL